MKSLSSYSDSEELIQDLQSFEVSKYRRIWEPFMKKYVCNIICEVGVQFGFNFRRMIAHNPRAAVAIDSWIDDGVISRNDKGFSQRELDRQYEHFKRKMSDKPFVKTYREYSYDAVKHFEDNYFDLIYIDADHTFRGCLRDIIDWYPKVKKGGLLLGDDYKIYKSETGVDFGVIDAVDKFAREKNLRILNVVPDGWGLVKI